MELFDWLTDNSVVSHYEVISFRRTETSIYYRIELLFVNKSKLFVSEYLDAISRSYSFHWQDSRNILLKRWDNAPIFAICHHSPIIVTLGLTEQ